MKIHLQKSEGKAVLLKIMKVVACGMIPLVSCILYCAVKGESMGSIYLPNTTCSDDVYYYKMVEGVVKFGAPMGYFGYNESHALASSFGAWSPVLIMPWVIWGKVFGWGYFSPIACNIFMLSASFAVFSLLAKPTWKQIICIALLFLSVVPFTTYVLSGRSEIIGYSLIIIIYGLVYSCFKRETPGKLIGIFLIITLLSLMRPYFMVFLLLPGILWVRRSKIAGILGTTLIAGINLLGYKLITYFFTAPYFVELISTDFIEAFKNDGFLAGCLFLFHKIYDKWTVIRWQMSVGVREGFTSGQIYFACCAVMLLLFIWLLLDLVKIRRQKENIDNTIMQNIVLESSQLLAFVIMMLAVIVLYAIVEGSRHILAFLIGFILVAAMRDDRSLEKNILTLAAFAYLFVVKYDEASLYHVPYYEERGVIQETEDLSDTFDSLICLNRENVPSYDNVVDWVVGDIVDGETREIPWRTLFSLPEGVGISCCLPQYIEENIDGLKGRYIIAIPNGGTDLLCQEKNMELLMRDEHFVLYKTY